MSKFDEYLEAVRSIAEGMEYIPQADDYKIQKDSKGTEFIDNKKMKVIKGQGFNYGTNTIDTIKKESTKSNPRKEVMKKYTWLQEFHPDKLK